MKLLEDLKTRADAYVRKNGKHPKQIDVTWDEYKTIVAELKKDAPKGWDGIPRCAGITLRLVKKLDNE